MDLRTRKSYERELGFLVKEVQEALVVQQELGEKDKVAELLDVFNSARELMRMLDKGAAVEYVKPKKLELTKRLKCVMGVEGVLEEVVELEEVEEVAVGVAGQVLVLLQGASQQIMQAYALVVNQSAMAAEVPVVQELEQLSHRVNTVGKQVSKLRGLS